MLADFSFHAHVRGILYSQVDMSKVKLDVIKPWITTKITQILGMEDDVVVEFVYNQLEEKVRSLLH